MLVLLLICLSITLIVLEQFVISGFHAKIHRLLPLVLGLVAVYDFYLIVEYISDYDEVFVILKDLLLLQVIFLMLVYVLDFMKIKLPLFAILGIFSFYSLANILVCTQINSGGKYRVFIMLIVVLALIFTMSIATWAFLKMRITRMEHEVYVMLFLIMAVPSIALILVTMGIGRENIIMPISLAAGCIVIHILIVKGNLIETEEILIDDTFNISDIPTVLFDKDLYYLEANEAAKKLFPDYIEKLMDKKELKNFFSYLEQKIDSSEYSKNEIMLDERYYNYRVSKKYVKEKLKGYVVQLYDITNQKMQIKEKSDFLAHMSHDLRSPLNAIINGSEILLEKDDTSIRNRLMLQNIKTAGDNLLDLVNAILEYSKLEAGKLELNESVYNFRQLVLEQQSISTVNLENKPVEFSVELMTPYPEYLIGDEMRVREIIQNIISNSIKFTDAGDIKVYIWAEINNDDVELKIVVKDTGCGIEEDRLEDIMEEYYTHSDGNVGEGTGLGFSIIKKLSEMMEGSVDVWSKVNEGTEVLVKIHQKMPDTEIIPAEVLGVQYTNRLLVEWTESVSPKWIYPETRILLADDMEVNREIFKDFASSLRTEVDMAEDGEQALELALKNDYELIFLDIMMPRMRGDEAAAEIKKKKTTPIIALSANEIKNDNFDDFLEKPLRRKKLQKMMDKYIPEQYRQTPAIIDGKFDVIGAVNSLEGYCRTLNTYIKEIEKIMPELVDYFKYDLEMFRTKVHGIKGISRQLGKNGIADSAEIMEMAAKAGHEKYIENHIDGFIGDLQIILSECRSEIEYNKKILNRYKEKSVQLHKRNEEEIRELILDLKEAFSQYNSIDAEKIIDELLQYELNEKEEKLTRLAKEACEAFDYEEGLLIIESYY